MAQVHLWQLALLIMFVAIAIVDIQDHGRKEPALILLASGGYAAFGVFCWLSWHALRRLESRLGPVLVVSFYAVAMGEMFLAATVAYLVIEYFYLGGKLL
jgi:hypothetical protein